MRASVRSSGATPNESRPNLALAKAVASPGVAEHFATLSYSPPSRSDGKVAIWGAGRLEESGRSWHRVIGDLDAHTDHCTPPKTAPVADPGRRPRRSG